MTLGTKVTEKTEGILRKKKRTEKRTEEQKGHREQKKIARI